MEKPNFWSGHSLFNGKTNLPSMLVSRLFDRGRHRPCYLSVQLRHSIVSFPIFFYLIIIILCVLFFKNLSHSKEIINLMLIFHKMDVKFYQFLNIFIIKRYYYILRNDFELLNTIFISNEIFRNVFETIILFSRVFASRLDRNPI